MKVMFLHRICGVCGMAWKETAEMHGHPRSQSTCPRCSNPLQSGDVVKVSYEEYP